jgi:hypothetical protein
MEDASRGFPGRWAMNVGMLWLDVEKETDLRDRLARAADYYAAKYGRRATLCLVHPETAGEDPPASVADLAVRVRPDVLRKHFWIGMEETS